MSVDSIHIKLFFNRTWKPSAQGDSGSMLLQLKIEYVPITGCEVQPKWKYSIGLHPIL
jgi:hypothetical protein